MTGRAGIGRWLLAVAGTVFLLGTSACGGSAAPSGPANADGGRSVTTPAESADPSEDAASPDPGGYPGPKACDLVTDQEAAALARLKLDPRAAGQPPTSCTWTAPVSGPIGQVEVYVGDGAKKMYDIARQLGHELETLAGIGDEAYLDGPANEAYVRKADVWVAVRLVLLNDPKENRKPLTDLLRVVAGRL